MRFIRTFISSRISAICQNESGYFVLYFPFLEYLCTKQYIPSHTSHIQKAIQPIEVNGFRIFMWPWCDARVASVHADYLVSVFSENFMTIRWIFRFCIYDRYKFEKSFNKFMEFHVSSSSGQHEPDRTYSQRLSKKSSRIWFQLTFSIRPAFPFSR